MNIELNNLPEDTESLKNIILTLKQENIQYKSRCDYLEEELRLMKDRFFNKKSEKITEEELLQGRLFDEIEANHKDEESPSVKVKSYRRKKGGKRKLPESLPRVEIEHDIPEGDKKCECGHVKSRIGSDETERLDIIPAKIRVEKHIRYKYACKYCEGLESKKGAVQIAPLPPQLIPQGTATPGLVAYILAGKYIDGTPLYRLEKIFDRFGVDISRQTMCNWLMHVYKKSIDLMNLMWDDLLEYPLIGMDETPLQVLKEPGRKNTAKSYMWIFRGGGVSSQMVLYKYQPTRSPVFVEELLKDYKGIIQTDDYAGYHKTGESVGIIHASCWAHARRKFIDAQKACGSNDFLVKIISLIGNLYDVERHARENNFNSEKLLEIRNEKAHLVLEDIFSLLLNKHGSLPPSSKISEAIAYTLDNRQMLTVYLDNPIIPIDNNLVENAIRPFVIGRKNWLFSGSPRGADASAAFYSLIETAKSNGLEPYWYLRYLYTNLSFCKSDSDLRELLPYSISMEKIREAFAEDIA
ncbi:MAG: IS66 family transposase [Methanosarcinaceae archaeon]|nr:IS66 family transposase [Methanosarcinaceae archaeon]